MTQSRSVPEKWYVCMDDTQLSGWGKARGKTSVFVVICDDKETAEKVRDYAKATQQQMTNIVIRKKIPKTIAENDNYHLSYKSASDTTFGWRHALA